MRRKDREVTDPERMDAIIRSADCCRLGFADGGEVYIVPLNFGYRRENGTPVFYFHGAGQGRKMELIRQTGRAGFELDTDHCLKTAEKACGYSFRFSSVIGTGRISVLSGTKEKLEGLSVIMEHYGGAKQWEFEERLLEKTAVLRLEATAISCKVHD